MCHVRQGVRMETEVNEMIDKFERIVFLIVLIVIALDLLYWRPL